MAEGTFDPLDRVRAGVLEGLLAALAGSVNAVRVWDWRREFRTGDPRGQGDVPTRPHSLSDAIIFTDGTGLVVGSGNPSLAAGAARGALSIQAQGFWPGTVAVGAGDYFGLNGRLYMATQAVTASGTGTATIPIGPPLRAAAAVPEPLVLTQPTVAMRLVSDDEAINPTRPGRFWGGLLDAEGAFVADPSPLWAGLMDTMAVVDGAEPRVSLACESRLVDLERAEVRRYTDADQQAEYPGDRFLEDVPALQEAQITLPAS